MNEPNAPEKRTAEETHAKSNHLDRSVSMGTANLAGLFAGGAAVALCILFHFLIQGREGLLQPLDAFFGKPLLWLPAVAVAIVIHELIHGLTWTMLGRLPRGSIHYGFNLKTFTPYAHCRVPMAVRPYWWGAAAPGLILGLLPAIVGSSLHWGFLTGLGWFMSLAAGGDLLILALLARDRPDALVEDHPTRAGCRIVENIPPVPASV